MQAIGRGNIAEPGRFGPGTNSLKLVRESGMSQGLFVQIGHQVRPDVDLQLYLFSEHALLVSGAVEVVYTFS